MSQCFQYRVVWKREGTLRKTKRYETRRGAEQFCIILGPTPWLSTIADRQNPDAYQCCSGFECCCGGETVREHWLNQRAGMPPLEYVRIERRTVGEWEIEGEEE